MKNLSRRDFLKGAAAGAVGVASVGLMGTGLAAEEEAVAPVYTQLNDTLYTTTNWREYKPVDAALITEVKETQVVVVGGGYSGHACARHLAECGVPVIVLEAQNEDVFSLLGGGQGVVNSQYCIENYGAEPVDVAEFIDNWFVNTNNWSNPKIVSEFAKNGGADLDWHLSICPEDDREGWRMVFHKTAANETMLDQIGHFKFWPNALYPRQAVIAGYERAYVLENGGEWLFDHHGEYLLKNDEGKVTGVVAQNTETGEYLQVSAKYVVIATGGFGTNKEMLHDLIPDIPHYMQDQDVLSPMGRGRDGSGIAMAAQIGAKLECGTIPTMDGRQPWMNSMPGLRPSIGQAQGIFLDAYGNRFMNEFWPPIEHRGFPTLFMNRDRFYCIYDSQLAERMKYVVPSHGSTDPTEESLSAYQTYLDEAYAVKGEAYTSGDGMVLYAGDTIDECLSYIDAEDRVKANIKASFERYNEMAAAGKDTDFARDPAVLFALDKGPFYLQVVEDNCTIGNIMVTMGGLHTDGDQRVLGDDWKPMEGLFATGNTVSGRFGRDYFTPLYGISIGMAFSQGRSCAKSIIKLETGEVW